jgi:hypothetical protein
MVAAAPASPRPEIGFNLDKHAEKLIQAIKLQAELAKQRINTIRRSSRRRIDMLVQEGGFLLDKMDNNQEIGKILTDEGMQRLISTVPEAVINGALMALAVGSFGTVGLLALPLMLPTILKTADGLHKLVGGGVRATVGSAIMDPTKV